jgi:hypothetical protein
MFVIVSLTLLTGFATSAILLHLGLVRMWLRYGLAAIISYMAFFGYLYLLIFYYFKTQGQKNSSEIDPESALEIADSGIDILDSVSSAGSNTDLSAGDFFEDLDFITIIVGLVLLICVIFSTFYVIYIAPELLSEVIFDVFISYGFYRVAKAENQKHWTESALRATIWPFLITFFVVTIGAAVLQLMHPKAVKFSEIFLQ